MWYRSYRNHVIMAFPSFDTSTSRWAPQASISWVDGSARKSEFVRFAKRVMTEGDAVALALRASHTWIDERLRMDEASRHGADNEAPSLDERSAPLKSDRGKVARRALTYAQFKTLMQKSGLGGSEESLHKSYTALAQLRKHNHCSWTHIKVRMKYCQENALAVHAKPIKTKPARLPLTMRDWRRVI